MKQRTNLLLFVLAYAGFISIGLPDGLIGVAWPSIRATFKLPVDALGALFVTFTAGYLISSFSSGRLLSLISVGAMLALSCLATATSLIGYALAPVWPMVVAFGALAGLGAGAIDAGLNTFAATRFSARTVNWLHACYGVGTTSGPLIMTGVMGAGLAWRWGYAVVGLGQLALTACFALTRRLWADGPESREQVSSSSAPAASAGSTLRLPVVWMSVAVFFIYSGVEAAAGAISVNLSCKSAFDSCLSRAVSGSPKACHESSLPTEPEWFSTAFIPLNKRAQEDRHSLGYLTGKEQVTALGSSKVDTGAAGAWAYSLFIESRGVSMVIAGTWVSVYWGAFTAGRIISGLAAGFTRQARLLRFCIIGVALGAMLLWLNLTNMVSFAGLALMGISSAPIFPTLIASTPGRLGAVHAANGVGFQIAAASLGLSLLPTFVGLMANRFGLEIIGPLLFASAVLLLILFEMLTAAERLRIREASTVCPDAP